MRRNGFVALAVLVVTSAGAIEDAAARFSPSAPLLVRMNFDRRIVAVRADGTVVNRRLGCTGAQGHFDGRSVDGRAFVCLRVPDLGQGEFQDYRLVTISSGAVRTLFTDTRERQFEGVFHWSSDSRRLATQLLERSGFHVVGGGSFGPPQEVFSFQRYSVGLLDVASGTVAQVAQEPPGDQSSGPPPFVEVDAWRDSDALLLRSGSRRRRELYSLQSGQPARPIAEGIVSPNGRYLATTRGRTQKVTDLFGRVMWALPGATVASLPQWSPDSRYVVYGTDLYDTWRLPARRARSTIRRGAAWAPDARHYAAVIGGSTRRVDLFTVTGRRVRTLFRIPPRTSGVTLTWAAER